MLDNIFSPREYDADAKAMTSEFFTNVYAYMFIALGISGSIAYLAGTSSFIFDYLISYNPVKNTVSVTPWFYLIAFAPIGLALLIQMGYRRLSMPVLLILFGVYAVLIGLSLSSIFIVYNIGDIILTFFVTAGTFGAMAVLGFTTKTDLSKFGSILYMAFIGIFIASLVNFFMHSEMVEWIISIAGVFVFTGLTAYYMQKFKYISQDSELDGVEKRKLSLVGGLIFYILFINLFLSLLRLLGSRE
ncbi:MAG: Bax inhibitor-1/YccA family protein [Bacteroidota bacterium]